ncbi:MAG: hypothetical protein QM730_18005 [Anaerolineales bacterium]
MSEWKRTTKEVPFEGLMPEMVTEIKKYIELYNLGPILADALMCIQTDSEKAKKGLFGSAEMVHQGAVVTPRWLVWVVNGTKTSTAVMSAQLKDVVIKDYAHTQFAKMVPDTGIEVSGQFTDVTENSSAFIGLDESVAGKKFKETVIQAAQDAKK